jgi:hypothetical protein
LTKGQVDTVAALGEYYYCFPEGLTLSHSAFPNKTTSLYIDNINLVGYFWVFHFSTPSPSQNYRPVDPYAEISPIRDPTTTVHPSL